MTASNLYWFIYFISEGEMWFCIDEESNGRRNSWSDILKSHFTVKFSNEIPKIKHCVYS